MIDKVFLPMLGETMTEATIAKWHKKEGDRVVKGDVLLEITTDKATLEVQSYGEGVLRKILAPEGMVVAANETIGILAEPDEPIPEELLNYVPKPAAKKTSPQPAAPSGAPAAAVATPAAQGAPQIRQEAAISPAAEPPPYVVPNAPMAGSRVIASPRAKRTARERRVGWRFLIGSGPGGRICERDVIAYAEEVDRLDVTSAARALAAKKHVDLREVKGSGTGGRILEADVERASKLLPGRPFERVELSAMRRVIAQRMSWSVRNIPQFSLTISVDMGACTELRRELAASGSKISYTDMIAKAAALALREYPAVASLYDSGTIIRRSGLHVGIAVALDDGLIVPVIRNADKLALSELSARAKDLIERARANKLTPDEFSGGVLTISNLGMLGVDEFRAIVNPGESAILACGRIAETPVVSDRTIAIRPIMRLTGSFDHRTVDGAQGARFLARVKELLESPRELV